MQAGINIATAWAFKGHAREKDSALLISYGIEVCCWTRGHSVIEKPCMFRPEKKYYVKINVNRTHFACILNINLFIPITQYHTKHFCMRAKRVKLLFIARRSVAFILFIYISVGCPN